MKKLFFVLLAMALFVTPVAAQTLPDDILDLPLTEIATGNQWHFCSQAATTYAEAQTTYTLANVTVTPGDGNDYTLQNDAVNGGRELVLVAQDPITLTANGTATHICVVDTGTSDFLGCADINGGTGRTITDYTTESGSYDGNAKFQMRDIQ